jgi:hypothetical protein
MPIRFFKNDRGRLNEVTQSTGLTQMNGMWRSLLATDIDSDGDTDIVAGNLGLNCLYHVSSAEPMQLFARIFDGNGSLDPVLFYYYKREWMGKDICFLLSAGVNFQSRCLQLKNNFFITRIIQMQHSKSIFKNKTEERYFAIASVMKQEVVFLKI